MKRQNSIPVGNFYNKYGSSNPIVKKIMSGFYTALISMVKQASPLNSLDVGCGEGYLTSLVKQSFPDMQIRGIDIGPDIIEKAKVSYPHINFQVGSIYKLPFIDNCFDLVVACEVLEHIEDPFRGIKELLRVSSKYCLLSVPREPVWRLSNLCRGKYVKSFGNTPGHIQHWSRKEFINFVSAFGSINSILNPFPWTMVLLAKKLYDEN